MHSRDNRVELIHYFPCRNKRWRSSAINDKPTLPAYPQNCLKEFQVSTSRTKRLDTLIYSNDRLVSGLIWRASKICWDRIWYVTTICSIAGRRRYISFAGDCLFQDFDGRLLASFYRDLMDENAANMLYTIADMWAKFRQGSVSRCQTCYEVRRRFRLLW